MHSEKASEKEKQKTENEKDSEIPGMYEVIHFVGKVFVVWEQKKLLQISMYCKPTNYFAQFKLAGFAVSVHPRKLIAAKMSDVMKTRKFLAPE